MGLGEIWVFSSPGPPSFIAASLLGLMSLRDGHSRQVALLRLQISPGSRNTASWGLWGKPCSWKDQAGLMEEASEPGVWRWLQGQRLEKGRGSPGEAAPEASGLDARRAFQGVGCRASGQAVASRARPGASLGPCGSVSPDAAEDIVL